MKSGKTAAKSGKTAAKSGKTNGKATGAMTTRIRRTTSSRSAVRRMVEFLNGLLEVDRDAMTALVTTRVPCKRAMSDHPFVQVRCPPCGHPEVGLLGILNGFALSRAGLGIWAEFRPASGQRIVLLRFRAGAPPWFRAAQAAAPARRAAGRSERRSDRRKGRRCSSG